MNNNFDFASKKSLLILLFICLVFLLLIARAFDYLPEEQDIANDNVEVQNINNSINQRSMGQNTELSETSQSENVSEQTSSSEKEGNVQSDTEKNEQTIVENAQESAKIKTPTEELIPIDENITNDSKLPPIEASKQAGKAESDVTAQKLAKAEELKQSGEYDDAIDIYRSITLGVSTPELTAKCYEEMSNIYAIQKKYGSAIIYAQKANKYEKTPAREKLIQSLIQKAGIQTSTKSN